WPSQRPFSRSFTGPSGRNRAVSQRWLKSPKGRAQRSLIATRRASRWAMGGNLHDEYPQLVHNVHDLGDKVGPLPSKFVDKPVVDVWPRTVHFVLPEGADVNRQTGPRSDPRDGPGNRV